MARCDILTAVLVIGVTTSAYAQFYDLYQALQPLVQSYTTKNPTHDHIFTTKRPHTTTRHRTTHDQTSRSRDSSRRNPTAISGLEAPYDTSRRRENTIPPVHDIHFPTPKPVKTVKSNQNSKPNRENSRNTAREISTNQRDSGRTPSRIVYEEPLFNTNTFDTGNSRRHDTTYEASTKSSYNLNRDSKNVYTTQNPLYNRPGVRPAPVDDRRPPITNRPQTKSIDDAKIPDLTSPELILGPNEDNMSEIEKRRYLELSERMCDRYKNLNTKQLQAIPLVPSPKPVEINITSCVPSNVPLIVGGKAVSIKEFPHMALIGWLKLHTSGYAWRCGGSLISNQFILTAAHCAYDERDNSIVMGPPRVVQLGSSYLDDPGALVVKVSAVVRHPKYKQPRSYYDIALIKMATTVTFSEVVKPACLGVPPRAGDPIIATGWGRTEFGGEQSTELRSVSIPVWGLGECTEVLGTSRRLPSGPSPDSQICAGERNGGKDTCQGDSGGPAQIQDGCVWRVVAVTSLGRACGAPNTPALYAKVQRAFVASVAFGKLVTNDGVGIDNRQTERPTYNNGGRNDNNRQTERPSYNNGGRIDNSGSNSGSQRVDNNRQTERPTYNNYNDGGRIDNSGVIYNEEGNANSGTYGSRNRQTTERQTHNNGGINNNGGGNTNIDVYNAWNSRNRQTTERNDNGGRINGGNNNQWNSNSRTQNNGGRNDNSDITSNNRQTFVGRGTNNRGTQSDNWNNNRQNDRNDYLNYNSGSNSVEKRDQDGGSNNRRNSNNNNYNSYNNPFDNNQPLWWT